jgi:probable addiction module antidote protein
MPGPNRPFEDLLVEQLADLEVAKHYLNDALDESYPAFLKALKEVAYARKMAGVQRETVYRSLSEQEDPTLETLSSILKSVGLKIFIGVEGVDEPSRHEAPVPF